MSYCHADGKNFFAGIMTSKLKGFLLHLDIREYMRNKGL